MRVRAAWVLSFLAVAAAGAAFDAYTSARQKFDLIESDRLRPGARVELTPAELIAYVQHELPDGVRNPRLEIAAAGEVTGSALVDFVKVRKAQGDPPGWLMTRLLEGERPVSVTARVTSGGGEATVNVERVQIGGLEIDGKTLDFLIQNMLLPLYPNAIVNRPFELSHRMEKLDIRPAGVTVLIGR